MMNIILIMLAVVAAISMCLHLSLFVRQERVTRRRRRALEQIAARQPDPTADGSAADDAERTFIDGVLAGTAPDLAPMPIR